MENSLTLDKSERYTAYLLLYFEAKEKLKSKNYFYGFCWLCHKMSGIFLYEDDFPDRFKNMFPELYSKKPKITDAYWFNIGKSGWKQRINLLKQCIEETSDF